MKHFRIQSRAWSMSLVSSYPGLFVCVWYLACTIMHYRRAHLRLMTVVCWVLCLQKVLRIGDPER